MQLSRTVPIALALLRVLGACAPEPSSVVRDQPHEPLTLDAHATLIRRPTLRAFYSGHSLIDGVPQTVQQIAQSLGDRLDFDVQSMIGSLIRERLAAPGGPQPGTRYDALVVTERHDLPWAAYHEATPRNLRKLIDVIAQGSPDAEVWLYHTWLESSFVTPAQWIAYERDALRLWECVASAANKQLQADGKATRVRVLPGATALTDLVENLIRGDVPSVSDLSIPDRMKLIFVDGVHFAPAGAYFMGAVHYAILFGQSPEGAAVPSGLAPELGAYMQKLAWQHVQSYTPRMQAGASRHMAMCRAFAAQTMCPAYDALRGAKPMGALERYRHIKSSLTCAAKYEDAQNPQNPFG